MPQNLEPLFDAITAAGYAATLEYPEVPQLLIRGDSTEVLKHLPDNSADSLVSDPPAAIEFMGKAWDSFKSGYGFELRPAFHTAGPKKRANFIEAMTAIFREAYRILKPGAYGVVWAIPRTSHWTATALETAGFTVEDVIDHVFGQGFPKSHNVSKALDNAAGATPPSEDAEEKKNAAPVTAQAQQWAGWGTALKPAKEHWILVQKPLASVPSEEIREITGWDWWVHKRTILPGRKEFAKYEGMGFSPIVGAVTDDGDEEGKSEPETSHFILETRRSLHAGQDSVTLLHHADGLAEVGRRPHRPFTLRNVAANTLRWGVGGLNVDAGRIPTGEVLQRTAGVRGVERGVYGTFAHDRAGNRKSIGTRTQGRWPSHLLFSHVSHPVLRLSGKLPPGAEEIIRGYFDGYSRVQLLREERGLPSSTDHAEASLEEAPGYDPGDFPSDSESGGVDGGEPPLEVLACDVPAAWLEFFEETGEDLGCVRCGVARIPNSDPKSARKAGRSLTPDGEGRRPVLTTTVRRGYGDSEGLETVETWICEPGCPVAELDRQAGLLSSGGTPRGRENSGGIGGSSGTASRFFRVFSPDFFWPGFVYSKKADKADKNAGLEEFPEQIVNDGRETDIDNPYQRGVSKRRNSHPTVKSTELMRYLVGLVTPPNGVTLDPFAGSFSTVLGSMLGGFSCLAIEREEEYFQIGQARVSFMANAIREEGYPAGGGCRECRKKRSRKDYQEKKAKSDAHAHPTDRH